MEEGQTGNNGTIFDFMSAGSKDTRTMLEFKAVGTSESDSGSHNAGSVITVLIPATAFLFAPALLGFIGLHCKAKTL